MGIHQERENRPYRCTTPMDPTRPQKSSRAGTYFTFTASAAGLNDNRAVPLAAATSLAAQGRTATIPYQHLSRRAAAIAGQAAAQAGAGAGQNGEGAPDPMRGLYEEYFRLPPVNGDAPMPVPAQGDVPRSASAPPSTDQAETSDHRVQRSIWGAPIVPGRFLAPPLGLDNVHHAVQLPTLACPVRTYLLWHHEPRRHSRPAHQRFSRQQVSGPT